MMNLKQLFKRLMDEAGEGGDHGAGGGAPAAIDGGTPGAASAAPSGELNPLQSAASPKIPEKFQVKREDGTIDFEASATKLAESYSVAEKRIGSGDVPPKTAAEYAITVPKALEGAWDTANDPQLQAFTEKAHGLGFTQKQIDLVIESYGELAPGLVGGAQALDAYACSAALREEWKTPADYDKNVGLAVSGLLSFAGSDSDDLMGRYGNDPAFIRMMAKIGAETAEDTSPNPEGVLKGDTLESLISSPAYRDPRDPNHAAVSAKVKAYYDAQAAVNAKTGNVPLI